MLLSFLPASAQTPVEVKVSTHGDNLVVETSTKAGEPTLRMNPDPAFLELSFPGATLQGSAFSKAIDKGLIQKVVTSQDGNTVLARVYVLSKPKTKLSKTADGYVYEVNLREMANAPTRTIAPAAAATKPESKPAAAEAVKPVATAPAPKPHGPKAPVTVKFENTPLKSAIEQLAGQAGMKAEVGADVVGTTSGSYTNQPMDAVLQQVLKPMALDLSTVVTEDKVMVNRNKPVTTAPAATVKPAANTTATSSTAAQPRTVTRPVTTTASTAPAATSSATTSTAANPAIAREYYPFEKKSAEKAMAAAKLAFPSLTYTLDPDLNILMVEGSAADIAQLEKFLRAQSPK